MQKWICKHKGLIPDSTFRRASRFDLTIDKGGNSNILVPTTAMRPDVTAKRYSRGTRELTEVDSKNSKEFVVKGKYANWWRCRKNRCWNRCTNLCLIDCVLHCYRVSYLYPAQKGYNQTRLGLEFQIKQNSYTKQTLITMESINYLPQPIGTPPWIDWQPLRSPSWPSANHLP